MRFCDEIVAGGVSRGGGLTCSVESAPGHQNAVLLGCLRRPWKVWVWVSFSVRAATARLLTTLPLGLRFVSIDGLLGLGLGTEVQFENELS
jgi:hypothetical protein